MAGSARFMVQMFRASNNERRHKLVLTYALLWMFRFQSKFKRAQFAIVETMLTQKRQGKLIGGVQAGAITQEDRKTGQDLVRVGQFYVTSFSGLPT